MALVFLVFLPLFSALFVGFFWKKIKPFCKPYFLMLVDNNSIFYFNIFFKFISFWELQSNRSFI